MQTFSPLDFAQIPLWTGLLAEAVLVALYTLATIVVPEVLHVNKASKYLLSLFVAPLLLLPRVSECMFCPPRLPCELTLLPPFPDSVINPAVVYALWYIRTRDNVSDGTPLQPVQVVSMLVSVQ